MRTCLMVLAGLCALLWTLGFFGGWHPALDSFAILRRGLFVAMVVCLVLAHLSRRWARVGGVAILGGAAVFWTAPTLAVSDQNHLSIYTKNLWHRNESPIDLAGEILQAAPDLVHFQEVSRRNQKILDLLAGELPFRASCPAEGNFWNVTMSRWPIDQESIGCARTGAILVAKIKSPTINFWSVNVHLRHPWPRNQWANLNHSTNVLGRISGPAVMAGDFNTVSWSAAASHLGELTGTTHVGPSRRTFSLSLVPLPLDQIWAQEGTTQVRPQLGSDHFGLFGRVTLGPVQ